MYPLVLSHDLVQSFKFWYQDKIHEGMSSGSEIYRLCTAYKAEDRQKAFSLAVALAEHGAQACVTCRRTEYKVWMSLRTQHLDISPLSTEAIAA
jgi:hypothetical protein